MRKLVYEVDPQSMPIVREQAHAPQWILRSQIAYALFYKNRKHTNNKGEKITLNFLTASIVSLLCNITMHNYA